MIPFAGHAALVFIMRAVHRACVVRSGHGYLRQVDVVGQVFHPVGIVLRDLLRLLLHVADRERIAMPGPERRLSRVTVGFPLRRDGRQRQSPNVLRQQERRDHDLRSGGDPDVRLLSRQHVERQHFGASVLNDGGPMRFDVEREGPGHRIVFARQDELLNLGRFRKSYVCRDGGHQRAERERHLCAALHALRAGGHVGVLHVAFAVIAGLYGRNRRNDDRTAVGLYGVGRVKRVKVIMRVAAPRHSRVAQVGFAFGRARHGDLHFGPLRSRLRTDDSHPVAGAPVNREITVGKGTVGRAGFAFRSGCLVVADRKTAADGVAAGRPICGTGLFRRILSAAGEQSCEYQQAEDRFVCHGVWFELASGQYSQSSA